MGTSNAAVDKALADARAQATADNLQSDIANASSRSEAFRIARAGLGAGQTFTYNGQSYSTSTAEERPDLTPAADSARAIAALNAANLATTTDASSTVSAQNDTLARIIAGGPDQSPNESKKLFEQNNALGVAKAEQSAAAAKAALDAAFGKDSTASTVVQQILANVQGVSGQTIDFLGGTASGLGLTGPVNALSNAGQQITNTQTAFNSAGTNEAINNVVDAVVNAEGFGGKLIAGARAVYNNPKSLNVGAVEVIQEAIPMALCYGIFKYFGKFI
jgi:hypothetical protein